MLPLQPFAKSLPIPVFPRTRFEFDVFVTSCFRPCDVYLGIYIGTCTFHLSMEFQGLDDELSGLKIPTSSIPLNSERATLVKDQTLGRKNVRQISQTLLTPGFMF